MSKQGFLNAHSSYYLSFKFSLCLSFPLFLSISLVSLFLPLCLSFSLSPFISLYIPLCLSVSVCLFVPYSFLSLLQSFFFSISPSFSVFSLSISFSVYLTEKDVKNATVNAQKKCSSGCVYSK